MDETTIWKTLQSSLWQGLDPKQLGYEFVTGINEPYGLAITLPGSEKATTQVINGIVKIENQNVTLISEKHGTIVFYFDEVLQHLRSLSNCGDRIVKSSEVEIYRKNSTSEVWVEIRRGLVSTDQTVLRETLFLITQVHGLKHRPMLPIVLELTRHAQPEIRAYAIAAGALQVVPLVDFLKRLQELKTDPDPWVRSEVVRAITLNSYLIQELEDDFSQDIRKVVKDLLSTKS